MFTIDTRPLSKTRLVCGECGAVVTRATPDGAFVRLCAHVGASVIAKVSADLKGRARC